MKKSTSVGMVAANFHAQTDEANIALWLGLLEPYNEEIVYQSCMQLIKTCTNVQYGRMPMFGYMQQQLDALLHQTPSKEELKLQASMQWNQILEDCSMYGRNRKPEYNELTDKAIKAIGGWEYICNYPTAQMHWLEKEFCEKWEYLATQCTATAIETAKDNKALGA